MTNWFKRGAVVVMLGLCMLVEGCTVITNPYKDPEAIRQDLLRFTPIGSAMSEVEAKLRRKYFDYDKLPGGFTRLSDREVIGVKHIQARLGDWWNGPEGATIVTGLWGFDADDKLVDVWVWKTVEGL